MAFSPLLHDSNWKGKFDLDCATPSNYIDWYSHNSAGFLQTFGDHITTTYNVATRQTFALCLTSDNNPDRIVTRLQRAQSFASNPFLLTVVSLSMGQQYKELKGFEADQDCRYMELTMGYDYGTNFMHLDQVRDSSQTTQRLKSLLTRIADIESECASLLVALDRLGSQLEVLPDEYCPMICTELREQVMYYQGSVADISFAARRGKDIVQAMVQTVGVPLKGLRKFPIH